MTSRPVSRSGRIRIRSRGWLTANLALLACALIGAQDARYQDERRYAEILTLYERGAVLEAVATLTAWPEAQVRAAIRVPEKARLATLDLRRVKSAAVLHLEVAMATTGDLSNRHITLAQTWMNRLTIRTPSDETARFQGRFHAFAASVHLVHGHLRRARLAIQQGLADHGDSPDLFLQQGVLTELDEASPDFGPAGKVGRASLAYQRALRLAPDFLPARLRLGRAYYLGRSYEQAREHLEIVRDRATEPALLYLAHLFLGDIAAARQDNDAALSWYEAARAIDPHAQSARLASMRAARVAGDVGRLAALTESYATDPPSRTQDPWWSYGVGLTGTEILGWLRREALSS